MSGVAPSRLVVHPGRGLNGTVTPPGDKSITHRAYLFGGLAEGETRVEGGNHGADCESTLACLEALGVGVEREGGAVRIRGGAMRFVRPPHPLDCGNSGTTLRLLAGPLAGQSFASSLAGDASLNRRPVDRVIEPLRIMGATLRARDGDRLPPLEIQGGPLRPIDYAVKSNSAQVASCVLLAGLFAPGTTTVRIGPARDHTERLLPRFGIEVENRGVADAGVRARSVRGPAVLRAATVEVPGDFSAAAFFLAGAAATPGASVTAHGVTLNPTRTGLLDVLRRMGATVTTRDLRDPEGEPVGQVTVQGPERLVATDIPAAALPTLVDEVPAWAMAAALAHGDSRIEGAGGLRVKETDRLAALATQLQALGIAIDESRDGLVIHGGRVMGGEVEADGDHRIAMAFAVLATRAAGPVTIRGAREIATSFPGFVAALRGLGAHAEEHGEGALAR